MVERKGLYIHIPFCISKCKYCDFYSIPSSPKNGAKNQIDEYIECLAAEMNFRFAQAFSDSGCCKEEIPEILIDTIYVGGGTPSILCENQIEKLFSVIYSCKKIKNVRIAEDCEVTIEVNPDDVCENLLKTLEKVGVSRISCGIQSMNDDSLRFVKRRSSAKINEEALKSLSLWKGKLSVDFICGLPFETEQTFLCGLDFIIKSLKNLSHISMYSLTIEDETPLGKDFAANKFDYDFDAADELWIKGRDFLEKNGFLQYEVSNFCKGEYDVYDKIGFCGENECRHNLKYWNHEDYFGLGCGSTGTFYKKNGSAIRWTNVFDVSKYIEFWKGSSFSFEKKSSNLDGYECCLNEYNSVFCKNIPQVLENVSPKTSQFEYFMMGLRKISGISKNHFEKTFCQSLPENFILLCKKWQEKGLCEILEKKGDVFFSLGKKGILFLNTFLQEL